MGYYQMLKQEREQVKREIHNIQDSMSYSSNLRATAPHLLPYQSHVSMRNSLRPMSEPIAYPYDVRLPSNAPKRQDDLKNSSEATCIALAYALGLPTQPEDASVIDRRLQIAYYLGCSLRNITGKPIPLGGEYVMAQGPSGRTMC